MTRINGTLAIVLSSVVVLLIVLVGWFALVAPQRSKASDLATKLGSAQTQLADAQHLLSKPNRRATEIALRAAKRALPDTAEMSTILRQLSAASATSKVELDTITPQTLVAGVGSESLPMVVTLKGRYFGIQKFVTLLQQSAAVKGGKVTGTGRLYTVSSITFTGQTGAASTATSRTSAPQQTPGLIAATVSITAYVYSPAPAPVGSTTTTTSSGTVTTASGTTP